MSYWQGSRGSSIGIDSSDYERACEQTEYISKIASGSLQVLVLGDEPLQSTFISSVGEGTVVRWISCESEEDASIALADIPVFLPILNPPLSFEIGDHDLYMFDSVLPFDEAVNESILFSINPGIYTVSTERYALLGSYDFLIHRLCKG
jgi:hypothetical protein